MKVTTLGFREIGRTEWLVRCSALAICAIGAIGMLGWLTGIKILARIQPQYVPIAPDTAFLFLVLGIVLYAFSRLRTQGAAMRATMFVLVISGMYGLLKLVGHVVGTDLTFSAVLFPVTEMLDLIPIGRMSPITGGMFFLASAVLFLLLPEWRGSKTAGTAAIGAVVVTTAGFIASVGYLYGTPLLYGGRIIPLAQHTAMGFLLLGAGSLAVAGPHVSWIRMFTGPSPTARMLRTFVPLTVAALMLHSISETSIAALLSLNPALVSAVLTLVLISATIFAVTVLGRRIGGSIERVAAERARHTAELAKAHRALRVLSESNQTLVRAKDEPSFLQEVCRFIIELGGYRLAWIGFVEHDDAKSVRTVAHAGFGEAYIEQAAISWADTEYGRGPAGRSIRTRTPVTVNDTETDPSFAPWRAAALQLGYRSAISIPLELDEDVIGVLVIYDSVPDAFIEEEIHLLRELALDLSYGIFTLRERAKHERTLKEMTELSERHRFLAEVLEHASQPFAIGYPDGRLGIANAAYLELLGYTAPELERVDWYQNLTPDEWHAPEQAALEELHRTGLPVRYEKEYIRKDGSRVPVELLVHLVRDEAGAPELYYSFVTDLTFRKRALLELIQAKERAERSDRLKDAFIANISHEIRTPLNVILGYSRIVEDRFLRDSAPEHHRYFRSIESGAHRLMRTVDMILSISRMQAGVFHLTPARFELAGLIEHLLVQLRPAAEKRALDLVWINQFGFATLYTDEHCLNDAISNLIDNAIKFTPSGSIRVRMYPDSEGSPCLEIKDTGVGIDEGYLPNLFTPYSQEEIGYTRSYDGIGLGLALVKKYLDLLHVPIDVASRKGAGTTFTLQLASCYSGPAEAHVEPAAPRERLHALTAIPDGVRCEILIVEDDPGTVEFMRDILSPRFDVMCADSAAEAWRVLAERSLHLLLLDISLQGGTHGLDLARQIRASEKHGQLPIIAVTAHAFDQDRINCLEAGCTAYVPKPVDISLLFRTIEKVLGSE